jgi:hypothetical protein
VALILLLVSLVFGYARRGRRARLDAAQGQKPALRRCCSCQENAMFRTILVAVDLAEMNIAKPAIEQAAALAVLTYRPSHRTTSYMSLDCE